MEPEEIVHNGNRMQVFQEKTAHWSAKINGGEAFTLGFSFEIGLDNAKQRAAIIDIAKYLIDTPGMLPPVPS
jgi:hypothetical protein